MRKEEINKAADLAELFNIKCRKYIELRTLHPLVKQNALSRSIRETSNELTRQLSKMRTSSGA